MKNALLHHYVIDFAIFEEGIFSDFPWLGISDFELDKIIQYLEMIRKYRDDIEGLPFD